MPRYTYVRKNLRRTRYHHVRGGQDIEAYLALVSVRVVREYADRPISDESLRRILEAGRATGSSQNQQAWMFYVVRSRERLRQLAAMVYAPGNIEGCQTAIAIAMTSRSTLDVGRCAQNMILAAWAEGIGSAPNGVRDLENARRILGIPSEETVPIILSLGYAAHPYTPREDDVEGILRRIKRKPLDKLVTWVD